MMREPRKRMTARLGSILFNVGFFGWTIFLCIFALPVTLIFMRPVAVHGIARLWARGNFAMLRTLCGVDHEISGLDGLPEGPCIVAAKHQSAWDTMVFPILLDCPSYVLKQELTKIPLFGWAIQRAGSVVVDRSAGSKALKKMVADSRRILDEGRSIVIFPEGTRTPPGEHLSYHPGVAALYRELGVPVVPVALNSGLYWGRRSFVKRPGHIQLHFLPAIPPGLPRREFMTRLEQQIEDASMQLFNDSKELPPSPTSVDKPVDA
jgi:1-acyl-sn-glycerol-3-phosphate acyltransferase